MKVFQVLFLVICSHVATAQPPALVAGKILDTVICASDPSQSYALYIPAKGNKTALPIIYCFDAHGDGALPLHKYQTLADAYGFILVGSNNSKNGNDWPTTENIWRHISEDAQTRLKINANRIYTCGFSGGAKVASYIALRHPEIMGVIANSAGLPDGIQAGDFHFSFTAIAGQGDMNMTDLVTLKQDLDRTRTRHRIMLFEGKHEWAPVKTMGLAFAGLAFDAMLQGLIPKDGGMIDRYIVNSKQRLDVYSSSNQLIKADQECKLSISLLTGLTDQVAWFQQKAAAIESSALYRQQQQLQQSLLTQEENTKSGYAQHFQDPGMDYWVSTIRDLDARANASTLAGAMYQRLLAYLSLAFYSVSNHLIIDNQNVEARHFVELYKMADPTNSEAWYFSAILHARDAQTEATENDLLKAAHDGFRDKKRLLQQPEFQNVRLNFSRINAAMR
jgi:hypothetical protein